MADWVTLNSDYLQRRMRLEWPKLRDAANRAANDSTAFDTMVTDVLSDVVNRVRGSVAANRANTLGAEGTVPPELSGAAVALARVELVSTIPGVISLSDDTRKSLVETANKQLTDAAAGKLAITPPANAATSAPDPAQGVYGGDTALIFPDTDTEDSAS